MSRANISRQQFLFGVEPLAADAVKALVVLVGDGALLERALQHLLHELLMLRVGGAHEKVVADVEQVEAVAKNLSDAIDEFLRLQSCRLAAR